MPQGKGTYGSQVGRPSKKGKKKYYGGGSVDPFSTRNPEGVAVEQAKEAIDMQNKAQEGIPTVEGIPTANAMDRSQKMPDVEQYNDGGFIKKAVGKYKREKSRKKAVKEFPIVGITKPEKKGLKPAVVPSDPPLFKGDTTKEKILNTSLLYRAGKKAGQKAGQKAGKKAGKKAAGKKAVGAPKAQIKVKRKLP